MLLNGGKAKPASPKLQQPELAKQDLLWSIQQHRTVFPPTTLQVRHSIALENRSLEIWLQTLHLDSTPSPHPPPNILLIL